MYLIYRALTFCLSPFIPLLLARRLRRGKEDGPRLGERLGRATQQRPQGTLLWVHAASVGETNSVLPLMRLLGLAHPSLRMLLTTVTVTSAALVKEQKSVECIHQFAPVDTPGAVHAFLDHWKPDIALWIDSELWPNLIIEAKKRNVLLCMINARISERSFKRWNTVRSFSGRILSCFSACFAQSALDGERLRALGMPGITGIGNLKYDAPVPGCDEAERQKLAALLAGRRVWLAACTHPGEEAIIAQAQRTLALRMPGLLCIIVPRHAVRGERIAHALDAFTLARRSLGQDIDAATEIYLADTMGELGLFYRLAPVAFIGGSLVPHGGQNPLEAAKLGCAVIFGPHMENFAALAGDLLHIGGALQVQDAALLADAVALVMGDGQRRQAMADHARRHIRQGEGITLRIMNWLQPHLA